jgi:hypothetical protein
MSELRDGQPPQQVSEAAVELGQQIPIATGTTVRIYDPWSDRWSKATPAGTRIPLPSFVRSLVIRIEWAK